MKPLKLTMEAFGSFVQGEVDFEQMPHGLYLIAGDTGAGKTTIFDAIVFALYGRASGADREPKMMHSDYTKGEAYRDTRVTLEFLHDGKRYRVVRGMHFTKNRKTGALSDTPITTAQLTGEDIEAVDQPSNVTERIVALTGMGPDQFKRVVMLAQGEFRAFLQDEKNRGEILSHLFDDSLYKRYEALLALAAGKVEAQRRERETEMRALLAPGNLLLPEAMDEAVRAGFRWESDRLVENLQALTQEEEAQLAGLEGALSQIRAQIRALDKERDDGARINAALEGLAQAERNLRALEDEMPERQRQKEAIRQADRALHGPAPKQRAWTERAQALERAQEEATRAERAKQAAKDAAQAQKARRAEAEQKAEARDALLRAVHALDEALPRYRQREDLRARAKQAATQEAEKKADIALQREEAQKVGTQLSRVEAALPELAGAEGEAIARENDRARAQERVRRLSGEEGLASVIEDIRASEQANERLRAQAVKAAQAEAAHHAAYNRMHRAFNRGLAGVLGEEIRSYLEQDGREVIHCPVCQNPLRRTDDLTRLARSAEGAPTQLALDEAFDALDAARRAAAQAREHLGRAEATLAQQKQSAGRTARTLDLPEDYEALVLALPEAIRVAREDEARARAMSEAAAARARDKKRLEAEREGLIHKQRQVTESMARAQEECAEHEKRRVSAEEALIALGTLPHLDAAAAGAERARLAAEAEAILRQIEDARETEKQAAEALSKAEGEEASAIAHRQQAEQALALAKRAFEQALADAGFADVQGYRAALPEEADGEAWLEAQRGELGRYERALVSARTALVKAQEATQSQGAPVDLQGISDKILLAQAQEGELGARRDEAQIRVNRHRTIQEQVARAKAALAAGEAGAQRLIALARLANNADSSAREPKTSFSRYIQAFVFREILEEANRHLDRMTGGKYTLVYRGEARDGRSASGLLIDVLDNLTGKTRDTASLSGGESFQASLALALGLSDVAQRHSGVTRVEAMFIDEGFGTLSEAELSASIAVLSDIAGGERQIGLISHVVGLEECIENQILVRRTPKGSRITMRV